MTSAFPVRFPGQLRQHLRAIRKERGLTQAQLGALVGVSQARIAEIEANPGLVSFEQLMKLLSMLGANMTLHENAVAPAKAPAHLTKTPAKPRSTTAGSKKTSGAPGSVKVASSAPRAAFVGRPKKGSW